MSEQAIHSRDRWIPWYFVLFFVVLLSVDGVMATIAIRTQTGVVMEHPYEKGVEYNKIIAAADAQAALGWKGTLSYQDNQVTLSLLDKQNQPVHADKITVKFIRPTQSGMDFSEPMTPQEDGSYHANPTFPLKGSWEIRVYAETKAGRYQQSKRIVVE